MSVPIKRADPPLPDDPAPSETVSEQTPPYPSWPSIKDRVSAGLPVGPREAPSKDWSDLVSDDDEPHGEG